MFFLFFSGFWNWFKKNTGKSICKSLVFAEVFTASNYRHNLMVMTNRPIEMDGLPIKNGWIFHGELLVITRW